MGHNISSINGVKSDNFYEQGNGINEIWVDDLEVISRLPFGDSDLGQAGWPAGNWPKIPWHQFIIPLKRDLNSTSNVKRVNVSNNTLTMTETVACCPCLKTYPEIGYFGIYKNWNPSAAVNFGNAMMAFGFVVLGSLLFLLQWNEVLMDLHGFMPDNAAVSAAISKPPIRAQSSMLAVKDQSGPEVHFENHKWAVITITTYISFQLLMNMLLFRLWGSKVRKDTDISRNLEQNQNSAFPMRNLTSDNPRVTFIQIREIEEPTAGDA
ncbi:uncharacterized protein N7484_010008 [Penicillium longicatenatum]|uniref:uncharacterized protein n=1 Tax=Penicillium longicatenatum TaxID=1561947 RepID=UPI00254788F6|nr:uncharacterized protein N7484_010008 [Penicillium longicatenatum]KAJ5636695.1 hypothetical protein N7484_010008 [Penicillium longicatenatum]